MQPENEGNTNGTHLRRIAGRSTQTDAGPLCRHLRAFRSIVLPLSRNSLITAGLFTFLFGWSDFLFALTMTTTEVR
jgi:ABC-type spermidine/putrescine transport system permease subunit I